MLLVEGGFAPSGVARPVEEAGRIEEREEVGGIAGGELRHFDIGRGDSAPHDGRVVPHSGGKPGGSVVASGGAAEVHAHLPAATVDGVAMDALLVFENLGSTAGIAGHNRGDGRRRRAEQETA